MGLSDSSLRRYEFYDVSLERPHLFIRVERLVEIEVLAIEAFPRRAFRLDLFEVETCRAKETFFFSYRNIYPLGTNKISAGYFNPFAILELEKKLYDPLFTILNLDPFPFREVFFIY